MAENQINEWMNKMKLLMTIIILLGIAVFVSAGFARLQAQMKAAGIICDLLKLQNVSNYEQAQQVQSMTSKDLQVIQKSFKPVMWLGGIIALVGTAGLVIVCLRKKQKIAQPAIGKSLQ